MYLNCVKRQYGIITVHIISSSNNCICQVSMVGEPEGSIIKMAITLSKSSFTIIGMETKC
jgi:hypothetical protein